MSVHVLLPYLMLCLLVILSSSPTFSCAIAQAQADNAACCAQSRGVSLPGLPGTRSTSSRERGAASVTQWRAIESRPGALPARGCPQSCRGFGLAN